MLANTATLPLIEKSGWLLVCLPVNKPNRDGRGRESQLKRSIVEFSISISQEPALPLLFSIEIGTSHESQWCEKMKKNAIHDDDEYYYDGAGFLKVTIASPVSTLKLSFECRLPKCWIKVDTWPERGRFSCQIRSLTFSTFSSLGGLLFIVLCAICHLYVFVPGCAVYNSPNHYKLSPSGDS